MLGPIQFIAFRFDTLDGFEGQILDQLEALLDVPAVRMLDVLFVAKGDDGELVALEFAEFGGPGDEGDDALGTMLGALMGFSFDGDPDAPPGEITEASAIGVTTEDILRVGRDLAPGTAAALLLVEHRWAIGLRDAIREAGGMPMIQGFLTLEGLVMVGAELVATAEAIAALEVADALEAEATIRSLEALATIEVAVEVEAAVAARAIKGLVDAGFLEAADAKDAISAIVAEELLERATNQEGSH
jgi:hypothetical protein